MCFLTLCIFCFSLNNCQRICNSDFCVWFVFTFVAAHCNGKSDIILLSRCTYQTVVFLGNRQSSVLSVSVHAKRIQCHPFVIYVLSTEIKFIQNISTSFCSAQIFVNDIHQNLIRSDDNQMQCIRK